MYSVEADEKRRVAGEMMILKGAKAAPEALGARARSQALRAIVFVTYLVLGAVFYANVDLHDRQHPYSDAFYLAMVTMSTVGYGDLSPTNAGSRAFTSIYILFGVYIIFAFAGEWIDAMMTSLEQLCARGVRCCLAVYRMACHGGCCQPTAAGPDVYGGGRRRGVSSLIMPAWQHYTQAIAFPLVVGILVNIVFAAWIFQLTSPTLTYQDAIWHCWVTATTVGYGDITLTTQPSRAWATAHVFLSVSWLANLLSRMHAAVRARKYELQRHAALTIQLSQELITALDRDNHGVNKVEFVIGMLSALGGKLCDEKLDYTTHVEPLLKRFEVLDRDHSGSINQEDLAFMVQASRDLSEKNLLQSSAWASGTGRSSKQLRPKQVVKAVRTDVTMADLSACSAEATDSARDFNI